MAELEKRLELMGEIQPLRELLHDLRGPDNPTNTSNTPKNNQKRATKRAPKKP